MAKPRDKARSSTEFVYVIAGDEPTLVNAQCTELVDRLIAPEEKPTGLWVADADKVTVSEVLDEVRTIPFLTKKRIVVVRNADKFISANRETLEKYFENPCVSGVLILTASTWQSTTRLAKKLPQVGSLLAVAAPKAAEIPRRLISYAREAHNKALNADAAGLLVELAGEDIVRLYTEVDKLAAYAAEDKCITAGHVEALVGQNRLFDAFKVIDACLQRKPAQAVDRLRRMFAEDKSTEYTAVGAFAYQFRRMFAAKKMLDEGHSEHEIAGKLKIWYNKDAHFAQLRRLSLKEIGGLIKDLAATDYAIKRGLAQARVAIEQLVFRMAS